MELSSSLEDYLEAIAELSCREGHAHSADIAKKLNVKKPSVTFALRSLVDKGLINYKPYAPIELTDQGKKQASEVKRRHNVIRAFLVDILSVDLVKANKVACEIEHVIDPDIADRLQRLVGLCNDDSPLGKAVAALYKDCE